MNFPPTNSLYPHASKKSNNLVKLLYSKKLLFQPNISDERPAIATVLATCSQRDLREIIGTGVATGELDKKTLSDSIEKLRTYHNFPRIEQIVKEWSAAHQRRVEREHQQQQQQQQQQKVEQEEVQRVVEEDSKRKVTGTSRSGAARPPLPKLFLDAKQISAVMAAAVSVGKWDRAVWYFQQFQNEKPSSSYSSSLSSPSSLSPPPSPRSNLFVNNALLNALSKGGKWKVGAKTFLHMKNHLQQCDAYSLHSAMSVTRRYSPDWRHAFRCFALGISSTKTERITVGVDRPKDNASSSATEGGPDHEDETTTKTAVYNRSAIIQPNTAVYLELLRSLEKSHTPTLTGKGSTTAKKGWYVGKNTGGIGVSTSGFTITDDAGLSHPCKLPGAWHYSLAIFSTLCANQEQVELTAGHAHSTFTALWNQAQAGASGSLERYVAADFVSASAKLNFLKQLGAYEHACVRFEALRRKVEDQMSRRMVRNKNENGEGNTSSLSSLEEDEARLQFQKAKVRQVRDELFVLVKAIRMFELRRTAAAMSLTHQVRINENHQIVPVAPPSAGEEQLDDHDPLLKSTARHCWEKAFELLAHMSGQGIRSVQKTPAMTAAASSDSLPSAAHSSQQQLFEQLFALEKKQTTERVATEPLPLPRPNSRTFDAFFAAAPAPSAIVASHLFDCKAKYQQLFAMSQLLGLPLTSRSYHRLLSAMMMVDCGGLGMNQNAASAMPSLLLGYTAAAHVSFIQITKFIRDFVNRTTVDDVGNENLSLKELYIGLLDAISDGKGDPLVSAKLLEEFHDELESVVSIATKGCCVHLGEPHQRWIVEGRVAVMQAEALLPDLESHMKPLDLRKRYDTIFITPDSLRSLLHRCFTEMPKNTDKQQKLQQTVEKLIAVVTRGKRPSDLKVTDQPLAAVKILPVAHIVNAQNLLKVGSETPSEVVEQYFRPRSEEGSGDQGGPPPLFEKADLEESIVGLLAKGPTSIDEIVTGICERKGLAVAGGDGRNTQQMQITAAGGSGAERRKPHKEEKEAEDGEEEDDLILISDAVAPSRPSTPRTSSARVPSAITLSEEDQTVLQVARRAALLSNSEVAAVSSSSCSAAAAAGAAAPIPRQVFELAQLITKAKKRRDMLLRPNRNNSNSISPLEKEEEQLTSSISDSILRSFLTHWNRETTVVSAAMLLKKWNPDAEVHVFPPYAPKPESHGEDAAPAGLEKKQKKKREKTTTADTLSYNNYARQLCKWVNYKHQQQQEMEGKRGPHHRPQPLIKYIARESMHMLNMKAPTLDQHRGRERERERRRRKAAEAREEMEMAMKEGASETTGEDLGEENEPSVGDAVVDASFIAPA